MKKSLFTQAFTIICLFTQTTAQSMVVPDRREFPVNPDINPCVNFYDYACSKVVKSFTLPDDRSRHTFSFSDPAERILEFKKQYFSNLSQMKAESDREQQLKNYYQACMNAPSRVIEEKKWVQTVQQELAVLNTREQLLEFLGKKMTSTETGLIGYGTIANQDRPDWNDVYFGAETMSLPEKTYYDKPDVVTDLEALYLSFFKTIGAEQAEVRAKTMLKWENELSKTYPLPAQFRDIFSSRTKITKAELVKKFPNLQFKHLLAKIPNHTLIRNVIPESFQFLNDSVKHTELQTLKDLYLFFNVSPYLDDAYPEYFKQKFDFNHKHLGGSATRPDRHERCTKNVMNTFQMELDSILWPRVFPNFPKEKFVSMAEKIRESLLSMLEANTWLSPSAKKEAILKIKTASLQLVAPLNDEEWNFNPRAEYSNQYPISNQKLFSKLANDKDLEELKGAISPKRWGMGPLTINAYYSPPHNKFVLPVGILQYPFFDAKQPESQNLAAIGTVIGHELGHAIDDKGSKYNSKGLLKPWMTEQDLKNFKERSSKLVSQFAKSGHNGELTLGENIGDLVGLTTSFQATFGSKNSQEQDRQDRFVRMKEFYISYARVWCEVKRPSYTELEMKTNPHSQGWARVNEQMKLQPGFQEAFQCKKDDAMVLPDSDQVKIWW